MRYRYTPYNTAGRYDWIEAHSLQEAKETLTSMGVEWKVIKEVMV